MFKYAPAVKQKVWNEAENREQDWGDFFTDFEKKTGCFAVYLICRNFEHLGPIPREIVEFDLGLSQIFTSKVFLSKNTQLELKQYCWAFAPRNSNDNKKCNSS